MNNGFTCARCGRSLSPDLLNGLCPYCLVSVGLGIKRPCPSTKSWMYFPDSDSPFYRVTYLSNYSPFMTPEQLRGELEHAAAILHPKLGAPLVLDARCQLHTRVAI